MARRKNPLGIPLWMLLLGGGAAAFFVYRAKRGAPAAGAKVPQKKYADFESILEAQSKRGYRIRTDPGGGRMCFRGGELRPLRECAHLR